MSSEANGEEWQEACDREALTKQERRLVNLHLERRQVAKELREARERVKALTETAKDVERRLEEATWLVEKARERLQ